MGTGQPEDEIMSEAFPESVNPIVAVEAGVAIGEGMCQGKGNIHLTVTGLAGVGCENGNITVMTVIAGERYIRSRSLMAVQGKPHHVMREEPGIHLCKGCIGSAMFGVAMATGEVGVVVLHLPVHRGNIFHLLGDHSMADGTAVRHLCSFPGCYMTGFTIPGDLSMRSDTAKDRIALRVQWTGVIQQSAPGIS